MSDAQGYDGYTSPEPSPGQGAPEPVEIPPVSWEPAPIQPETQPKQYDDVPPDSPRFKEVYWKMKEQERQNAELREQMEAQLIGAPQQPQYEEPHAQQQQSSNEDDPWGELRSVIGEAVEQRLAPLQQQMQFQQQAAQVQENFNRFKQVNPEFDVNQHGPRCMQTINAYRARGVNLPLDAAYTVAFPQIAAQKMAPPQVAPQAPLGNVGGQTSAPPAASPDDLWSRVQREPNPGKREELFNEFIASGGAGVREAEAKLGW